MPNGRLRLEVKTGGILYADTMELPYGPGLLTLLYERELNSLD